MVILCLSVLVILFGAVFLMVPDEPGDDSIPSPAILWTMVVGGMLTGCAAISFSSLKTEAAGVPRELTGFSRKLGKNRRAVLILSLLVAAAIGAAARVWYREALFAEYESWLQQSMPASVSTSEQVPYRQGRLLPVDPVSKRVDRALFDELPDALRPGSPDQIGTLVFVRRKTYTRTYANGAPAVTHACTVELAILASGEIFAKREFQGSPPPEEILENDRGGTSGSYPDEEVVRYLTRLRTK